jgi:hypothetical protein
MNLPAEKTQEWNGWGYEHNRWWEEQPGSVPSDLCLSLGMCKGQTQVCVCDGKRSHRLSAGSQ